MTVAATVAIAFAPVDATHNPNVDTSRMSDHLDPYYWSMTVSFASVKRWNPAAPLVLVTNTGLPRRYERALERLEVETVRAAFTHDPPAGFSTRTGSLFMLDALAALGDRDVLWSDPDIFCIRDLGPMVAAVGAGVGAMPTAKPSGYPPDHAIAGLSRRQAGAIHGSLGEPIELPVHYGGECYVVPAVHNPKLVARVAQAWSHSLELHAQGRPHFTTEEHVLSFALRGGVPVTDIEPHVRRIWTAARTRTVRGDERELTLWHLPAEKARGFREMYGPATDPGSWFWSEDDEAVLRRVEQAMGLRHRRPARIARDVAGKVYVHLRP